MVNGDSMLPKLPVFELQQLAQQGKFPPRNMYRDYIPLALKRLINKALNIHAEDRYKSAEDMRHALEQQAFQINWVENVTGNSVIWQGVDLMGIHHIIEKTLEFSGGWNIETRRGSKLSLRRVGKYCFSGLSKTDADQKCRKLLQDYVTGKA